MRTIDRMDDVGKILKQWNRERPDLDVTPMGLIGRVKRLFHQISQEMDRTFAKHGMNLANFDVLATLRRSGDPYRLSPSELMASTMVTSGTMTNRIDQLVKLNYVERSRNPNDGRSFLIGLTDEGLAVIDMAVADHVETLHQLTSGLSPAEFRRLDRLLGTFLATLER